jgi:hypothetical protein
MFWSCRRDLFTLSRYSRWELGPSFWKQGGNPHDSTILNLPGRNNSEMSPSADKVMFTVFWDYNGAILLDKNFERRDNQLWPLHHDADRTQEAFQNSLASQETDRNLASVLQCYDAHKSTDWGSHHNLCLGSVTTSTIQHSLISRVLKNAICSTQFETDDIIHTVRTWIHEQNNAWYKQGIHKLALCWYSTIDMNGNFVEKQGVESEPSLFITRNLCNLLTNIHCKKHNRHYLLGSL